jgi:hypothetical protein
MWQSVQCHRTTSATISYCRYYQLFHIVLALLLLLNYYAYITLLPIICQNSDFSCRILPMFDVMIFFREGKGTREIPLHNIVVYKIKRITYICT